MENLLHFLTKQFTEQKSDIDFWFQDKYTKHKPLIYSSVDLRYSGSKIAPVDTNIFPAGFNNLSKSAKTIAADLLSSYLKEYYPNDNKIILISESHTRNKSYLENIETLKTLFENTGKEIKIATLEAVEDSVFPVIEKKGSRIEIAGFNPDLIITNNDLTAGHPEILDNIEQDVIPATNLGWYRREKHRHFLAYQELTHEFCQKFSIPKFLINTETGICKNINFKERKGLECIALETEKTLKRIQDGYNEFNIKDEPYVYIKANRGTYGMGIMTVKDPEEIFSLNKKNRNKMNVIKNKTHNEEILIQEGIATIDEYNGKPAEPFIYQVSGKTAGVIYRFNESRDKYISLNATGAEFAGIEDLYEFTEKYLAYDVITRLASLATCYEEDHYENPNN